MHEERAATAVTFGLGVATLAGLMATAGSADGQPAMIAAAALSSLTSPHTTCSARD
jgi:hypothetical protein